MEITPETCPDCKQKFTREIKVGRIDTELGDHEIGGCICLQSQLEEAQDILEDIRKRLKGHHDSVLEGEHGLAAATMRGFEGYEELADYLPIYEDNGKPFIPFKHPCWIVDTTGEVDNCTNEMFFRQKWMASKKNIPYFTFYSTQKAALKHASVEVIISTYKDANANAIKTNSIARFASLDAEDAYEALKSNKKALKKYEKSEKAKQNAT